MPEGIEVGETNPEQSTMGRHVQDFAPDQAPLDENKTPPITQDEKPKDVDDFEISWDNQGQLSQQDFNETVP